MMRKKKKLLLIKPFTWSSAFTYLVSPPMGLGVVAALTPGNWDVEIVDYYIPSFYTLDADLVGITSFTLEVNKAYEIARVFRKRGIPTVMGGIHASLVPDEASKFADTVVIGEAESVWHQVISDFEKDRLQERYKGESGDLKKFVPPKRDLFHPHYLVGTVQTSRGCPFNCSFCYLTGFESQKYRQRPVEAVLDELETIPQNYLFFVDDNFIGYSKKDEERVIALCKGMMERRVNKKWSAQVSINFAANEELLKYAAKSGCKSVCIGVEAEDAGALEEMNKGVNLEVLDDYKDAIHCIRQHGIAVIGSFIYGMDRDTPDSIRRRADFILDSEIDTILGGFLTPNPGTALFKKLQEEGRLLYTDFPRDWSRFNWLEVVHQPLSMEVEELRKAVYESWQRLYSPLNVGTRFLSTLANSRDLHAAAFSFGKNLHEGLLCLGFQVKEYVKPGKDKK